MATEKPRFLVTLDADLKTQWEEAAKAEGKSLSKWVIDMVEKARSVNPESKIHLKEKQKGDHGYYEKEVKTKNGSFIQLELPIDESDEKSIKEIEDAVACPRCMDDLLVEGVCPSCNWIDSTIEQFQESKVLFGKSDITDWKQDLKEYEDRFESVKNNPSEWHKQTGLDVLRRDIERKYEVPNGITFVTVFEKKYPKIADLYVRIGKEMKR